MLETTRGDDKFGHCGDAVVLNMSAGSLESVNIVFTPRKLIEVSEISLSSHGILTLFYKFVVRN